MIRAIISLPDQTLSSIKRRKGFPSRDNHYSMEYEDIAIVSWIEGEHWNLVSEDSWGGRLRRRAEGRSFSRER
jgi:hypothetical protein